MSVSLALAGPWTRPPGSTYTKVGVQGFGSLQGAGAGATVQSYQSVQLQAYAEVGVVPRVQVAAATALVGGWSSHRVDTGFDTFDVMTRSVSMGDVWLMPQLALHDTVPVALSLDVKLPAYGLGAIGGRDALYGVLYAAPGDGQVDVVPRLAVGASRGHAFAESRLAWIWRTDVSFGTPAPPQGDGIDAGIKGGWGHPVWLAWADLELRWAVWNRPNTRQWFTASAGGGRHVAGPWWIEMRTGYDLWSRVGAQGLALGVALSHQQSPSAAE